MAKTKSKEKDPLEKAKELQGQARGVIDDVTALVEELEAKAAQLDELAVKHDGTLASVRVDADPFRVNEQKMRDLRDLLNSFTQSWRKHYGRTVEAGYLK